MLSRLSALAVLALSSFPSGVAAEDASDLAQQLSNPVASLISVPFQYNYDENMGPAGTGRRSIVNVQPVVPISIGENWNLISRTIIPLIDQKDVVPGTSASGVGDVVQSFFFSPKAPTAGGLIWGAGPAFVLPTATNAQLGADQFAAGVTGVVLKQTGPWTIGALGNHVWDMGGGSGATDISASYIQPFLTYTTPNAWTFSLNSETTYDWVADEASVPINLFASKLVTIGNQNVSIGGGVRYWADSVPNGPTGWGARLFVTFLYPK